MYRVNGYVPGVTGITAVSDNGGSRQMSKNRTLAEFVRPRTTTEDRRVMAELARRGGLHGKSRKQVRPAERQRAIAESLRS
jgi:hypothetical protein